MYSDEEDTEEYTEHFEEDTSSSTADVEEHVELYTDYGSASIANMTDIEELYTDYGSASIANMDDIDELYIDTCSTSMDDMVEHHHEDDIDPTMSTADAPTYPYLANGATYEDRGPPRWHHHIIDIMDIIWSIKSAPNMSHHLGKARTVIDSHHLMIVVDHHHLMVYIDILPHMIFDDTTQDMVMRQEDESLDMKTFLIRRLLPLAPPPQWPLPRHMPMDSDATSASNKATFHGNVPISYVSAKKLYFDELNAQVSKMPPLEDDLGGDGVEHGEHGILPSPTEAHGVEMVEHGKFPSTKEAHGDEQVEPTPICLIDELVPIPCEHESHLAHLSESDSELSDFHPICEFECFHLEDMSDTQSSTEDEFPLMETMYMVHEDDDISPCLLQDGHVDHMDPPTSTTPTSNESAYKGADVDKDQERRNPHGAWKKKKKEEEEKKKKRSRETGPASPPHGRPGRPPDRHCRPNRHCRPEHAGTAGPTKVNFISTVDLSSMDQDTFCNAPFTPMDGGERAKKPILSEMTSHSVTSDILDDKMDVGEGTTDSSPRPTSPPSGPMTRARAKAIHDKVNSLLTTLDLGTPLDGMLPHAETLCVIRYMEHQDPGEDETPWSREGEEQRNLEMNMKPKPTSPEERQGRKGRWPVQDPVRPDPRPDAPATGPVNRAQTGPAPSYRTTTGPRTGFFAESRLATGRPDPGPDSPVTGPVRPDP
ncbi:hypothetical protein QYE76_053069 [Lolium multiflorum]|uniref:Uncharacterized protein n=1 Tax=Lolium multiflorum TaxID=4521 RepID=A0AAD8SVY2_LOLMU|nr:hypothetical protein QYE76_053069 [Lolium multiflorum]